MTEQRARFAVGDSVTVTVGSHAGDVASVEYVVWSDKDACHYFYLVQGEKKLSRGYRADELGSGAVTPVA